MQASPPNSSGYLNRIKPLTRQEAAASYSNENITGLIKSAISKHIQSFFSDARIDKQSAILSQFGRGSTRYIVDKDFDPNSDKTKVKLPIHKFFEEIKSDLPCIIVSTSGCTFKTSGLGVCEATARLSNGSLTSVHHIMREVPVVIMIVTTSQQDTECLAQTIQMMFGELSGITTGFVLHGDNEYDRWALHLPKIPEFSGFDKNPIGDSVTQLAWSNLITLTTLFEDNIYITYDDNRYTIGNLEPENTAIYFPSTLRVGKRAYGKITGVRVEQKIIISDPSLATLRPGETPSEWSILAKKPGLVSIQVVEGIDNVTPGSMNFLRPNVVLEHAIQLDY